MGKKEEYINWMQSKLDEVSADIDKLKAKANQAEAEAQMKYLDEVEAMRKKKADMQAKLKDVQTASEGAWEDMKTGLDKSWNELKTGIESAWSRFKG